MRISAWNVQIKMQCVIEDDVKWSKEIKRRKLVGFCPNLDPGNIKKAKKKYIISNDSKFKIIRNFILFLVGVIYGINLKHPTDIV